MVVTHLEALDACTQAFLAVCFPELLRDTALETLRSYSLTRKKSLLILVLSLAGGVLVEAAAAGKKRPFSRLLALFLRSFLL